MLDVTVKMVTPKSLYYIIFKVFLHHLIKINWFNIKSFYVVLLCNENISVVCMCRSLYRWILQSYK